MRDARSSRNKADYKLDDVAVEHLPTAELIVTEAGRHLEALRAAFREPALQGIIADLDAYKQKMKPGYR